MHVETPHHYRHANVDESEEAYSDRLARSLEEQIQAADPDTIAAFIAEPVMGAGGVVIPPAGYFQKVQAVLNKYDILFIADEVICGFGRTGNAWGCDTYGIKPDIMTCAKQLSSAYLPIAAVLISDKLHKAFKQYGDEIGMFGTGTTYGGHPVAAAVALETLNIYESDKIFDHVKAREPRFSERVQALQNHPLVGQARSVGLIGAIELVADKSSKDQFPVADKMAAKVMAAARKRNLIVRATPGDSVAFCPPLIINDDQIDEMFDAVADALNEVHSSL